MMIGYKIAKNGETRVLVTLEIPSDALTNIGRSSVVVRETASYRANKAMVLKIEDAEGHCYTTATSFNYILKSLDYTVGSLIEEPTYNCDPEKVYAEGIHFFLSRMVAELYGLATLTDGVFERWYENGLTAEKSTFVASKKHGLCQVWHKNGIQSVEDMYINGKKHGFCQEWHENGRKYEECTYVDGKKDGLYTRWYGCGDKVEESTFVVGKRHGLCRTWYKLGSQPCERIFVNGIMQQN